ncbi:acylamino-acid-releasing enzyme-like isoform X6 [Rhineura floridana]|uniref:acylamino-acid-releasing enzyme-like isoform X6 n=1 Tax=Rhineura floridana TaxID=261503 RepID=UPI002AC80DCE|nr:acylamino-acid-releasing enzyme-like isoform X6 [Rhineura floridana]
MAYRPERAKEALPGDFGPIGDLYQELSQFPSVVYASVGVGFAAFGGAECLPLYTEWCQPDLGRHQKLQFSRQYILHHDGTAVVPVTPVGVPVEIRDQLLIRMSPTGMRKAVLTHHLEMGQKQEVLEQVWSNSGRVRSINLTALDKHGRVYTDGQFGCFAWSSSETQILYVAERRHPKRQPLFSQDSPPQEGEKPVEARKLSWQTKLTSTVVDIVRTATTGFFGIYSGALPLHCWAGDNHRVLLSTPQRSRKELLVVDTKLGSVKCITAGTPEGSWTLLGIQQDLLVMSCSSPNCPPSLVVGVLPPAGSELELQWTSVEKASVLPDTEWKTLTVHPTVTVEGNHDAGQAFEALLLSPQESKRGENIFPLVVSPHGGPHAVFDACWCPKMACLCQLGFAVLMVNYRGSLGFGQASIESLISHVGVQDVEDTQLAVELALQMEPLDPDRIALLGGSHGGFVCCHLIGRYPEMYKACAVRSPVINMATLLGTSDIPDWRYAVLGLPYCFERIPTKEDLAAMLLCSPIIHAAKVRTPLLICVGAKDRRVSPYQAMEYYRVLRAREIPVKLLWYPEENHAISGVEAGAAVFLNCAQWMIHHLSKESADAESQQAAKTSEV